MRALAHMLKIPETAPWYCTIFQQHTPMCLCHVQVLQSKTCVGSVNSVPVPICRISRVWFSKAVGWLVAGKDTTAARLLSALYSISSAYIQISFYWHETSSGPILPNSVVVWSNRALTLQYSHLAIRHVPLHFISITPFERLIFYLLLDIYPDEILKMHMQMMTQKWSHLNLNDIHRKQTLSSLLNIYTLFSSGCLVNILMVHSGHAACHHLFLTASPPHRYGNTIVGFY